MDPLRLTDIEDWLNRQPKGILGEERYTKVGILIPLIMGDDGRLSVLFEKRAASIRQPGDICFPGGKSDERDASPWETAKRETCEELNLMPSQVRYVGEFGVLVAHNRMLIYPFVGFLDAKAGDIRASEDEVEEVFASDLEELLRTEAETYSVTLQPVPMGDFPFHRIEGGVNYQWRKGTVDQYFYEVGGRTVWGLTARLLTHFLELVRTQRM